ncbi:hypothetical protein NKJ26_16980 [Mesorhizobium sp. M0152]|uniref:ATP-dependent DNA ligase n=1 Tax=unclassified Mesorhizobium TaxID=325217 RepID=UPI00333A3220
MLPTRTAGRTSTPCIPGWSTPSCSPFVAFDILHKDGEDLRQRPAIERKAILWELIKPAQGIIQYSQYVEGGGAEFFEAAE